MTAAAHDLQLLGIAGEIEKPLGVRGDPAVALGAVAALSVTAGASSLLDASDSPQPLARALSFPDLVVRIKAGLALGRATPMFKKMNRFLPVINVVSGFLLVGVGYLVFQNIITRLNEYFDFLPYVNF